MPSQYDLVKVGFFSYDNTRERTARVKNQALPKRNFGHIEFVLTSKPSHALWADWEGIMGRLGGNNGREEFAIQTCYVCIVIFARVARCLTFFDIN